MNDDAVFRYNYSAKRNEEVQAIRNKYLPQQERRPEERECLDRSVPGAGRDQKTGRRAHQRIYLKWRTWRKYHESHF